MDPAAHQRVPITVVFDEGDRPPLHAVTRALGRGRIDVALPPGHDVPPTGAVLGFTARLRGQSVEGRGCVAGCRAVDGQDDVLVLELEVTSLAPAAERVLQRVGFRRRLEGWVLLHPTASAGLPELLAQAQGAPDTRPVDGAAAAARAPTPARPGDGAEARKRPRARRHHWDLDSRFRPRS